MATQALIGCAFGLLALFIAWRAWHRCVELTLSSASSEPWIPHWCASTGGSADRSQRPSQPITIRDIDSYRARIAGWVESMGVAVGDIDDVTQKTIIGAWNNRASYDPARAELGTWLYAVAQNQAATYRQEGWVRKAKLHDPRSGPWLHVIAEGDPEEEASRDEAKQHGLNLIARLPPERAAAFLMRAWAGEGLSEIAIAMGVPKSTAVNRIIAARIALTRMIERNEKVEGRNDSRKLSPKR